MDSGPNICNFIHAAPQLILLANLQLYAAQYETQENIIYLTTKQQDIFSSAVRFELYSSRPIFGRSWGYHHLSYFRKTCWGCRVERWYFSWDQIPKNGPAYKNNISWKTVLGCVVSTFHNFRSTLRFCWGPDIWSPELYLTFKLLFWAFGGFLFSVRISDAPFEDKLIKAYPKRFSFLCSTKWCAVLG